MIPRPPCQRCGGSGVLVEYRLIWKRPRQDQRPLECSRRVEDEADGGRQARVLEADAYDIDVLSGVKDCWCKKAEPEQELAAARWPDWKMRQAGDN